MRDIFSNDMTLDEATHTYRLADEPLFEFESCTEFIGRFFEPFRAEEIAAKVVVTSPKYRGRTVESVLAEWEEARDSGSRVHAELEGAISEGEPVSSDQAKHALDWLEKRFPRSRHEYLTERIIYSVPLRIAGTVDLLVRDRDTDAWALVDWKTNKRIDMEPFRGKQGVRGPGRRLGDCHAVKYGLQLSLYHYILETEYGIDPERQGIVHLSPGGARPIACSYARDDIVEMLEFQKLM